MKLAILCGGQSHEHEISIVSAIALKSLLHCELIYIFCDTSRHFYQIPPQKMNAKLFSSGAYTKEKALHVDARGFVSKGFLKEEVLSFDILLNLVHGADGEDGTLSALLDFYAIPYIGPRMEACCVSFNKHLTKLYAKEMGIGVLPYQVLRKDDPKLLCIPYPIIIKPLRLGSSIGISIVKEASKLDYALDVAFEFDDTVLIEPFIEGIKEYNVAGAYTKEGMVYSIIEEPHKELFLDFDKKYLDFSRTKRVQEATLSQAEQEGLKKAFTTLYGTLFQGALIRCDFFIHEAQVYLNEINPIPGSMANYLFDDFEKLLYALGEALPPRRTLPPQRYAYIHTIHAAKGK